MLRLWVPTKENVADHATRITLAHKTNYDRWFVGPVFLYGPEETWPKESCEPQVLTLTVIEWKTNRNDPPHIEIFSQCKRLKRATAYVQLFIRKLKDHNGRLSVSDRLLRVRGRLKSQITEVTWNPILLDGRHTLTKGRRNEKPWDATFTCLSIRAVHIEIVALKHVTKRTWKTAQALADEFWRRWVKEYLPTLNARRHTPRMKSPVKIGDVVIIMDPLRPRNVWPRGIITKTHRGPGGESRSVEVESKLHKLRRPVMRIVVLPTESFQSLEGFAEGRLLRTTNNAI
ncbi:unnamed protein product [Pieris macdunnoughi]|uniref:DUF5641 domain-containing protein n=1 Tax=Pieris macdunnoughi TaxID=345717 RepID=A0A821KUE3_9NEOP|nr:unnamed protein product [Pieris macdunnoughi]